MDTLGQTANWISNSAQLHRVKTEAHATKQVEPWSPASVSLVTVVVPVKTILTSVRLLPAKTMDSVWRDQGVKQAATV